jgi:hypothetical protein
MHVSEAATAVCAPIPYTTTLSSGRSACAPPLAILPYCRSLWLLFMRMRTLTLVESGPWAVGSVDFSSCLGLGEEA